jgi:hypothetical protein
MVEPALSLSGALRDELEHNATTSLIDPRTVPVRFSTLKMLAKSPLHYWHAVQHGYDESLSMRLGSGTHAILFDQPYAVFTGPVRRGKDWDAFKADHDGAVILNAKEHATAQAMVKAIRSNVRALALISHGDVEKRIDWTWQDRAFRSTPDVAGRVLVDLKCLKSAEPDQVMWQSRRMHYHVQAALYRRALASIGRDIREAFLIVVENKAPHPVTVFQFTETALEQGDKTSALWMEKLRSCEEHGVYGGYVQTVVDLDLPAANELLFDEDEETSE